jgi:hypothetical protein
MKTWMNALVLAGLMVAVGCDKPAETGKAPTPAPKDTPKNEAPKGEISHSGWWCDEHGVPESECSMCSAKVRKECKAKGDWCDKHDRAKSHCFICDPSLKEKFAARYEAKYGKQPPPPEDNMPEMK